MSARVVTALFLALVAGAAGADEAKGTAKALPREETVADVVAAGEWTLASVSARRGTIALCEGPAGEPGLTRVAFGPDGYQPLGVSVEGLPVAADARVSLDGKPAKLADLKRGMRVKVRLGKEPVRVTKVEARSVKEGTLPPAPSVWHVRAVDPKAKRLTVTGEAVTLKNLEVTEDTKVTGYALAADSGVRAARLDLAAPELKEGASVGLLFGFDAKTGQFTLGKIDVGMRSRKGK